MRKMFPSLLAAVAVVILSQAMAAEEANKRPQQHNPRVLFSRLDANKDGQVTPNEIPAGAPERLKEVLKRADKNGDKKLTAGELDEAMRRVREAMAGRRPNQSQAKPQAHRGPGRPQANPQQHRGSGHSQAGPGPGRPDPKVLFARMDKNNDKKLSIEEFSAGMQHAHQMMQRPGPPFAGRPSPPFAGRPGPMHGPGSIAPRFPIARQSGILGQELFRRADADKDGKVSLNEVRPERREGFKRLLARADKNGDQALSIEEARQMRAAAVQRLHAGAARTAPSPHQPRKPELKRPEPQKAPQDK